MKYRVRVSNVSFEFDVEAESADAAHEHALQELKDRDIPKRFAGISVRGVKGEPKNSLPEIQEVYA